MTRLRRRQTGAAVILVPTLVGLLPTIGMGQPLAVSPEDLIRSLTYQSDAVPSLSACEDSRGAEVAAESLVKRGASAIPDIGRALRSIEELGEGSEYAPGAGWLVDAYAEILGPDAFVRLRKMLSNPKLAFLRLDLDSAIALSLNLTFYVSGSRVPVRLFLCDRRGEPRDALNQLILAWESNDIRWLQGSLGPRASIALNSLLEGRAWADMRAELWRGASGSDVGLGYRFVAPGLWSRPEARLGEEREYAPLAHPDSPDFETRFVDASGGDCGKLRVSFLETPRGAGPGYLMYVVDNSDIGELLRLIGSCAAGDSLKSKP